MTTPSIDTTHIPPQFRPLMLALARGGATLAGVIRRGDTSLSAEVGINSDGDGQKRLDIQADALFRDVLREAGLRWYASEEQDAPLAMQPGGAFALAIDPLDGSSNIDTNVSIGTIFAVYPAADQAETSFLRPARDLIAGGYVIYGPRCCLVVSFGDGTQIYTLNPDTHSFDLTDPRAFAARLPRLDVLLDASGEKDIELGRELASRGRGTCRVLRSHRDVAPALSAIFGW